MERKAQSGYLLLADISGYTSYVAQTEIEHADMALSYLLETLVEQLSSLLTICQLEGDAVFAYLEESKLEEAKSLLELIDQTEMLLSGHPALGRAGRVLGTRELVIGSLPYIVAYRVRDEAIEVLRVLHASRRWPGKL